KPVNACTHANGPRCGCLPTGGAVSVIRESSMCGGTHRLEHESPDPAPIHAAERWSDQRIWHIKPDLRFDGVSRPFSDCIKSIDKCCIDGGFGGRSCLVHVDALRCLWSNSLGNLVHYNRLVIPCLSPLSHAGGCVTAATTIPISVTINGCVVCPSVAAVLRTVTTVAGNFSTADGEATIAPAIAIVVATTFVILS